jgi:hypothetical protein
MLIKILLVVVVAALVLAGFVASRPAEFSVSRSRTVAAPPDVVHGYVNDLRKWVEWSPWEKKDPALKREYSGAAAGPGASYHWVGNREVGEGRMTIVESNPGRDITLRLEFLKPFAATHSARFDFAPSGPGTAVTWTMRGEKDFMGKAVGLLMDMDKMIGTDFERGLAGLDAVSAATARNKAEMVGTERSRS